MADAAALLDLGAVLLYFGAFILAALAYYLAKAVADHIDVSIFGYRPFSGIATAIENAIVSPLKDIMDGASAGIAKGLQGVGESLATMLGLVLVLGVGVKDAFAYLWNQALEPRIESVVKPVRRLASEAHAAADSALTVAAYDLGVAERYAEQKATAAEHAAGHYTDAAVAASASALRAELSAAIDKVRAAEDAAVTHAMQLAADGIAAAEAQAQAGLQALGADVAAKFAEAKTLIAQGVSEAEAFATAGITAAEKQAADALAASQTAGASALAATEATFTSALEGVKSIAVTAEDDLTTVLGKLSAGDVAAIIASVPLLATLVNTLATETGLENQACRSKVKGICATDPAQWGSLLAGLGVVTGLLSLEELVTLARPMVSVGAAIVREAA